MKTTALRLHGENDLRLETFDLPDPGDDEILADVVTDSICMSSLKAVHQGAAHKRVPDDVAQRPVILGHEFAGRIRQVGRRWADQFKPGDRFSIQPALNYQGSLAAPGYSFAHIGGAATQIVIPSAVMEMDCLLPYNGDAFFKASLSEPLSCVIGAVHSQFHMTPGTYVHRMGIVPDGRCVVLGGTGPMGLALIDYLVHGPVRPRLLIVTGRTQAKLDRAARAYSVADAEANGVELVYSNVHDRDAGIEALRTRSDGEGFDDVFVMAASTNLVEQGDQLLGRDGCLNFFAGPTDPAFSAPLNLYNVHYNGTHIAANSGGNTDDMREALELMAAGAVNPAGLVTHVGGITAAKDATLRLAELPGAKKLIYTQLDFPLTAIDDFGAAAEPLFNALDEICGRHGGLWNTEAELYLLDHAPSVQTS